MMSRPFPMCALTLLIGDGDIASDPSPSDTPPSYQGALLRIRRDAPIRIISRSQKGVPVLLVTDGAVHPLDAVGSMMLSDTTEPFPGNPVAFAIAEGSEATLDLMPPYDGVWEVWAWVLRGKLRPVEAEVTPEMAEESSAMGFTPEMLAVLMETPEHMRAWWANSDDIELASEDAKGWRSTTIELEVKQGPSDAPPPRFLFREYQAAMVPAGQESKLDGLNRWHGAVDALDAIRGDALSRLRDWSQHTGPDGGNRSILETGVHLRAITQHPLIRGPLLRRHSRERSWSENAHEAAATISLGQRPEFEIDIICSDTSKALARSLRSIGALDAVLVGRNGEVVASTSPGSLPTIHRQAGWASLEDVPDGTILSSAPSDVPGYEFPVRTIAAPVRGTEDGAIIGWVLAVMADLQQRTPEVNFRTAELPRWKLTREGPRTVALRDTKLTMQLAPRGDAPPPKEEEEEEKEEERKKNKRWTYLKVFVPVLVVFWLVTSVIVLFKFGLGFLLYLTFFGWIVLIVIVIVGILYATK